ncbi:serine hydrolase domain-containing protein [Rhodococcus maanshanensis]|uniref:D-alanyl-D-alanine carboxypeptidase n=1 Tax=Rhodococcus maanshanensis TaxID=183556 RepID=A0A1H7SDJ5_9NOCA|nr:serine hydrolase domain-containing protein [Rhodococcus maanshanensis]SEL70468.1 D-alanyl-D-alanine carboxypeptidase [Rhodococcus maanshanensis]
MRSRFAAGALAVAVTALLAGATPALAQPQAPATATGTAVQQAMDRILANGAVGVQVRTTRDGRTATATAGSSVLGTPWAVPDDGRFRIGSVTKMFIATVLLQLVEEERVELDAPVSRYLPGLLPDGDTITVRMLLQHTSGLYNYTDALPLDDGEFLAIRFRPYTPHELVDLSTSRPLDFAPGTDWAYSNTNYIVLGMLIEKVTGRSWDTEVAARITTPLGMLATSAPRGSVFIPAPHARGYHPVAGVPVDTTELDPSWGGAAGEMISTTADLDLFLTALIDGRLLRSAQLAELTSAKPDTDGYGLGAFARNTPCGLTAWGHSGGIPGYTTLAFTTLDGSRRMEASVTNGLGPDSEDAVYGIVDAAICG